MPIYLLKPVDVESRHWTASERKEPVRVRASTEQEARRMAARAYGIMPESFGGEPPLNPWLYPQLVECVYVSEVDDGPPAILD